MRDLEIAWAALLLRAMEADLIPRRDARLLARAGLGLYNSGWAWDRPHGIVELASVYDFYTARILAMVGTGDGKSGCARATAVR